MLIELWIEFTHHMLQTDNKNSFNFSKNENYGANFIDKVFIKHFPDKTQFNERKKHINTKKKQKIEFYNTKFIYIIKVLQPMVLQPIVLQPIAL